MAQASASGQNAVPRRLRTISSIRVRSSRVPSPASSFWYIFGSQVPTPSRQGVHLPHDSWA
jgi:hypothetical protein